MRVLHVIPSVASRYGGPSEAVAGMCRGLEACGVRTMIATTNADGDGVLPVPTGVATTFEGLDAVFFPRVGERFKYSGPLARWLRGAVRDFDVVHIHAVFSHSSIAAGRACRRHRVPYILRPLGSLDPWALRQGGWQKRLLLGTSVRRLIDGARALHFTTDEEQRLAAPVAHSVRGVVIPPGVDGTYLSEPIVPASNRDHVVVALARLHPKKRLDVLIRAFQAAASAPEFRGWRLAIAGEGEAGHRAELQRLAASEPTADRIAFVGWLTGDVKREWLSRAAIFAMPSHQENFGLSLVEALARGVPAIVARGVNLSPLVESERAGWVVGPEEDDLRDALTLAMRDDADREARSVAARTLAARFTWAETARQLAGLYRSLRAVPVGGGS